jgi:branched-chain amino acid transport system ATP-binding protein
VSARACVRLRSLYKRFGGLAAVRGVDFEVGEGERRVVLGPNGAGKTTLFNLISGIELPSSGRVQLFERDVTFMSVRRRARLGVGRTFQTSRVLRRLSVADNLYLGALGAGQGHLRMLRSGHDRLLRGQAQWTAEQVGLSDRMEILADALSYGEQRQLELGLAIAGQPRLLLLDEPAAGLSVAERRRLAQLVRALDRSITVVMVEHDMDVALGIADRVTVMNRGSVVIEGSPAEVRRNEVVRDIYLGRARAE